MFLVKNKLKKMKKDKDDDMLYQLKYTPHIDDDDDFEYIPPKVREYRNTATQAPETNSKSIQTDRIVAHNKQTDTGEDLNKIIGSYILSGRSWKHKNQLQADYLVGDKMTQVNTIPIVPKDNENRVSSGSGSSDSEGPLVRNLRRGVRLAELAGHATWHTISALDTATGLTVDAVVALNNLINKRNDEDDEEEQQQQQHQNIEEEPSGSNDVVRFRERSRSRDSTDYEPDDDLGERLLRRGASRSRSSTPPVRRNRDKSPKKKK